MSICYKYAPDGSNLVVLDYVDGCIYLYTSEEIFKWFFGYTWKEIPFKLPSISTLVM